MLDFKKYLIKHFAKIKVIHSIPGRLRLKVPKQVYVAEEFRQYDRYVVDGVKLLDGIEDIQFNYVLGTILLTYDTNKVYEEKVLKWINRVVEIIIKNISWHKNFIKNIYAERNRMTMQIISLWSYSRKAKIQV